MVKADAYGHGAGPAAAGGPRGRCLVAGGGHGRARRAALREHGLGVRMLVMGALTLDELRACEDAEADVVAWTDEVAERGTAGCTSSSTPGWGGWGPRTASRRCGWPPARASPG